MLRYLVISPVKNEEKHIEHTLQSMLHQTVKPVCWTIVDDGSTDRTAEIIDRYRTACDFIRLVRRPSGRPREPGSGVVRAFNIGAEVTRLIEHDIIVKLDCDLSFGPDYFERLLAEFSANPKLGIASGVYQETSDGLVWHTVFMPDYHAAGASKLIRRECFMQIGGFVIARGWDTVDEIRAIHLDWHTAHFPSLKMKHWKPEGTGIGRWHTTMMHGEIYYLTGGGILFLFFKVLHRMWHTPMFIGGLTLLLGYMLAALKGKQRLVTRDEARCYRALLNGRLILKAQPLLRLFKNSA